MATQDPEELKLFDVTKEQQTYDPSFETDWIYRDKDGWHNLDGSLLQDSTDNSHSPGAPESPKPA